MVRTGPLCPCIQSQALQSSHAFSGFGRPSILWLAITLLPWRSWAQAPKLAPYPEMGLAFETNEGQAARAVQYLSRSLGHTLYLTRSGATFTLDQAGKPAESVSIEWAHCNPRTMPVGVSPVPAKTNYLVGNDSRLWRRNIQNYARVAYRGLYPGVDLVYYGKQRELEYDLTLAPNVDVGLLDLNISGAKVRLTSQGDLVLTAPGGTLVHHKPRAYQVYGSSKKWVGSRFKIRKNGHVGFEVDHYDKSRKLVIDPVWEYSEYFGFAPTAHGYAVATDGSGCIYITGDTGDYLGTGPNDFPTTAGSFQTTANVNAHAFVTKITADGSQLVYSTFLGGSSEDHGYGIAVSSSGNAYITGITMSSDLPTTAGAIQTQFIKSQSFNPNDGAAFVTELSAAGDALVYSTFLGGPIGDKGNAIALDPGGNAYVAGVAKSPSFPVTPGALQTSNNGLWQAFVSKINPNGTALVYSTLLGGSSETQGLALALDESNNVYLTGTTYEGFPTTVGAFESTPPFPNVAHAFVSKIDSSGGSLVYSTLLTGTNDVAGADGGTGIAVDSTGSAYVTGYTANSTFPVTPGAFETSYLAIQLSEAIIEMNFVAKLNPSGSGLVYATFLGASLAAVDYGRSAIVVDPAGTAYLTGQTSGIHFPTTPDAAYSMNPYAGSTSGSTVAGYFSILSPNGSTLRYSSYWTEANAVALDGNGYLYLTGFAIAPYGYLVVTAAKIQAAPAQPARLSITKQHSGNFVQGQNGATYSIKVSNAWGAGSTSGPVMVTENIPSGMTLVSMNGGPTWDCTVMPFCTTNAVLNAGLSYPAITVTVNVADNATSQVNQVTLSAANSATVTANDSTVVLVPVTVQTVPAGLSFSLDGGALQTAPQTLNLVSGQHALAVQAVQSGSPGTQYVFNGWNDSGAASHPINVSGGSLFTASFGTQYQLITIAAPSVGGSVSPVSGGFIDSGASVALTATATPPFAFNSWTGDASGIASAISVVMSGPKSVMANFGIPGFSCDPTRNGFANTADVTQVVGEALGLFPATDNLAGNNFVSVADIQIVIDAAIGFGCFAGYH
jgi:Divergent InlB B-repeat domain/Domain of unknown function DUF11/Beta-propeller repeat